MSASLVGSEMCIRDSKNNRERLHQTVPPRPRLGHTAGKAQPGFRQLGACLLYTSDAADDM
eukprot:6835481-Alexandrium_andersonii.AAC.1